MILFLKEGASAVKVMVRNPEQFSPLLFSLVSISVNFQPQNRNLYRCFKQKEFSAGVGCMDDGKTEKPKRETEASQRSVMEESHCDPQHEEQREKVVPANLRDLGHLQKLEPQRSHGGDANRSKETRGWKHPGLFPPPILQSPHNALNWSYRLGNSRTRSSESVVSWQV